MAFQNVDVASNIQRSFAAMIALCTTVFFIWIDNVKAFVSQRPVATLVCDFIQTSSAAAWIARFPRTCSIPEVSTNLKQLKSVLSMNSLNQGGLAFFSHKSTTNSNCASSAKSREKTALHMASYIGELGADKPILQTSPFKHFQSWFCVMDPRLRSPVYDE